MHREKNGCRGLHRLVQKCRSQFKRPENTKFYSAKDYAGAERKFVKFCLRGKVAPGSRGNKRFLRRG